MLGDSLDKLRASDPDKPDMECTWEPLPDMVPKDMPEMPDHASLWQRLQILAGRFFHGQADLG